MRRIVWFDLLRIGLLRRICPCKKRVRWLRQGLVFPSILLASGFSALVVRIVFTGYSKT